MLSLNFSQMGYKFLEDNTEGSNNVKHQYFDR